MEKLKYIFAQPDYVEGEGIDKDNPICIYPVRLKDYDKFIEASHLLHISKNHFEETEYPLLLLVLMSAQQLNLTEDELIKKLVQEWANKVLESRSRNSTKISIEDIITTVSVYKGKDYSELLNYTIYQIYADFYRIRKMKKYDTDTLFATVSSEKFTIEDFAEEINMFKSPYDDLFVSSDKLNKLN